MNTILKYNISCPNTPGFLLSMDGRMITMDRLPAPMMITDSRGVIVTSPFH